MCLLNVTFNKSLLKSISFGGTFTISIIMVYRLRNTKKITFGNSTKNLLFNKFKLMNILCLICYFNRYLHQRIPNLLTHASMNGITLPSCIHLDFHKHLWSITKTDWEKVIQHFMFLHLKWLIDGDIICFWVQVCMSGLINIQRC